MRYDLHMHTYYSRCASLRPGTLLNRAKKKRLDGVAVTDHHSIKGALEVKKLNKDRNFEVIVGSEITTDKGDVLCLYLSEDIKSRNLFEVIDEVREQDGLVIVAHPFRTIPWLKFRYPLEKLKNKIHGIETFNSRMLPFENKMAKRAAKSIGLAETGGSDSHFWFDVGNAWTEFPDDLRKDLKNRRTKSFGGIKFGIISGVLAGINKKIIKM